MDFLMKAVIILALACSHAWHGCLPAPAVPSADDPNQGASQTHTINTINRVVLLKMPVMSILFCKLVELRSRQSFSFIKRSFWYALVCVCTICFGM